MDTSLSNDQKQALEVLKSGANVFLDGLAGTGKTFLIDYYTRNYCSNKKVLISGNQLWLPLYFYYL